MNRLEPILASTRRTVAARREHRGEGSLRRLAEARPASERRDFAAALAAPGLSVIAEHKRRSPSAGRIREELSLASVVTAYERGGARALSILTEEESFGGSLDDLRAARSVTTLPILRKDFTVDPYQLLEAAAYGADAVLLIVAALRPAELRELYERAGALGLAALVEVHDERELELAASLGAAIVGINNRDLSTLEVDTGRVHELIDRVPEGAVVVAESGFSRPDQLAELARDGVDAVLVGEALMRAPDIERACRSLTEAREGL